MPFHSISRHVLAAGLTVAIASAGTGPGTAQAKDAPVIAVTLDPNQAGPTIDRHIFGQFAEHLGPVSYTHLTLPTIYSV